MTGPHRDGGQPSTILAFDPDSRATAYVRADLVPGEARYEVTFIAGGGSPKLPVGWQDVLGCMNLLSEVLGDREPAELAVVVETQATTGPYSADCEPLRRVRYHLESACLLLGVRCVMVDATTWMRAFVPEARSPGAAKRGYQANAKALVGAALARNEDRAAAVGIAWWFARELGGYSLGIAGSGSPRD